MKKSGADLGILDFFSNFAARNSILSSCAK